MNLKKILLGIGLVIFGIIIIYSTPVTIRNPIFGNIIISVILVLIEAVIFYFFMKSGKSR